MNKITPKQRDFILSMLDERDLTGVEETRVDTLVKCLRISEDPEEFGMDTKQASKVIDWLLARPRKEVVKKPQEVVADDARRKLPAGRYAIENEAGELRFYRLWVSRDGKRRALYVMFGPSDSRLFPKTQEAVCAKILAAGFRECAIRFGNEIGACSACGRRLTNRISRELGIGPICGGRMFNGDWASEVKAARDRITARGQDPDEELNDLEEKVAYLEQLKEQHGI